MAKLPTLKYFLGLTPQKQITAALFIGISAIATALVWVVLTTNTEIKTLNKTINKNNTECEHEKAQLIIDCQSKTEKYLNEQIEELKVKNMRLDSLSQRANQIIIHAEKKQKSNAKR